MRFFTLKGHRHSLLMALFICLMLPMNVAAQKLEVISLEDAVTDNTAWNPSTSHKLDDGRYCPVVKVEFNQPACNFEGGIFEGKKPVFKTNEYWVYMLPGARHLIIKHPNYDKIDVFFDEVNPEIVRLKEKHTYILKLKGEIKKGLESVEKGEASSMLKMAQNYENGTGAYNKNIQQALEWYEKAAEAGSFEAQEYLADVLYEGKNGFQKNENKALRWNEACAKRGNTDAMLRTAQIYEHGSKNLQAAKWYEQFDNKKPSDRIQFKIAYLYKEGSPERVFWLKKSADSGNAEAAYFYAMSQLSVNKAEAVTYFKNAIAKDYVKAMDDYGRMLFNGENGIERDMVEGRRLLEMASSKGASNAKIVLDTYELQQKQDAQMAAYVHEIPQLTTDAKNGDIEAFYKLYLIYDASGDRDMAYKIKVALYYNCYITVPRIKPDDLLSKKALQLTFHKSDISNYRDAIDGVITQKANILESSLFIKLWAQQYYDKDCMNYYVERWKNEFVPFAKMYDKNLDYIDNLFDYQIAIARLNVLNSKKRLEKYEKKEKNNLENLISTANLKDKDKEFTPWIRQLKDDGYLWSQAIQDKAKRIESQKQEEEAKKAEEERKAQLAKESAAQKQKEIDFVNEIKSRGKRQGMTTITVNGAVFNMVPVRGGSEGNYYISEMIITNALYNAVMSNTTPSLKDYSEYPVFSKGGLSLFIDKLNKLTKRKFRAPDRDEIIYATEGGHKKGKTGSQKPTDKTNELGMIFVTSSEGYFWENWENQIYRSKSSNGEYHAENSPTYSHGANAGAIYSRLVLNMSR